MTNTTNTVEQNNTKLDDEALDAVQGAKGYFPVPQPQGATSVTWSSDTITRGGQTQTTSTGSATLSSGLKLFW